MQLASTARPRRPGHGGARQHGAVLILSMVLLAVITLLGVNSMGNTRLEMRMAASFADNGELRLAAESVAARAIDSDFTTAAATSWQEVTLPPGNPCAPARWRAREVGKSLQSARLEQRNYEIEAECVSSNGRTYRIVTGASYLDHSTSAFGI